MPTNKLSGKGGGKGGGPSSRALGKPAQYFVGQPSQRVSPKGISQIGESIGNHSTDSGKVLRGGVEQTFKGKMPVGGPGGVPLGNQLASNVGGGGPGAGRVLYGQSGVQGQHGPSAPGNPRAVPNADLLREFGPDVPGRK